MQTKKRLINTILYVGSRLLRPVFSFFLIRTIYRVMGVAWAGRYTTVFAILLVFEMISIFGLNSLLIKEVSQNRNKSQKYFFHSILIALPIVLGCIVAMNQFVSLGSYDQITVEAVWVLSLSLIATALNECIEGVIIGYEETRVVGIVLIVENILRVVLSVLFIHAGCQLLTLVYIYIILRFCIFLYYSLYLKRTWGNAVFKFEKKFYISLFRTAKIFAFVSILVIIYGKVDILMLSMLKGKIAVGIYDGAFRFYNIVMLVIFSTILSIVPIMSEKYKTDFQQFVSFSKGVLKFFLTVAIPGAALLMLLSRFLIVDILDPDLTQSVKVLIVLSFAVIPYGITEFISYFFLISGNHKYNLLINGIGVACNVILNYMLIPRYSYLGAAIATLISINFLFILQMIFINVRQKRFKEVFSLNLMVKFVIALFVMAGIIVFFRHLHMPYVSLIGIVVYGFLIWHLKIMTLEDRQIIGSIVKNLTRLQG